MSKLENKIYIIRGNSFCNKYNSLDVEINNLKIRLNIDEKQKELSIKEEDYSKIKESDKLLISDLNKKYKEFNSFHDFFNFMRKNRDIYY